MFDFRLKVYPNPMRDDGVFVAEDRSIQPYGQGLSGPLYPAVPDEGFRFPCQLEPEFAAELVRRWNAEAPETMECPACRGAGNYGGVECEECWGKGRVTL